MARASKASAGGKQQTYTYRGGSKLVLQKAPDAFVVRALGADTAPLKTTEQQQVSSHSTRVKVRPAQLEAEMTKSRKIAPTFHDYQVADSGAEFLITDRILVRFKPGATTAQIDAVAGKYGLVMREKFSDTEYMFQVTEHSGVNPVKIVVALTEKEPLVDLAENDLNQRVQRHQFAAPTDTQYQREWHLHEHFQHAQVDPKSSSRCEQAWQLLDSFGDRNVVIAISDDGCRLDHADFDSPGKFAAWGYFKGTRLITNAEVDALPQDMYQSGSNHGTSCAGVAAGEADGVMTVGAAPGCRLLPIKWESDESSLYTSDSKLRRVLDFIADKADVMSNSWGLVPDNLFGTIVTDRIAQLSGTGGRRGRGIVFLWAAGNENCPIQFTGNVDVPYTDGWGYDAAGNPRWVGVRTARRFRNTLVGLPGVMHVAALASTAQRSHYSNYGTGIDVCAPTSNSHAFWRMTVPGLGVVAPTGEGQRFTVAFGGTSSATPLAAGVAALVISAHPLLSAADVISILRKTASKDLDFTGYARTPPASYDPNPTWDVSPVAPFANGAFVNQGDADGTWSPWFGFGKLDAERAVTEALARRTPPVAGAPVTGSSSPNRQIPDNDATGIEDSITLAGTGQVGRMKVNVDVEHTYIGDLVITLVAPDGSSTVLHNRAGGSQKNLKRQWDSASDGVLAALNGAPLAGPWKLRIRDAAAIDVGRLKQWSLAVEPAGVRAFANTDEAGVPIPENDAGGVTRTMQVDVVGRIVDIAVDLDITHPYIGDVRATLTAPSGQQVVLHDRTGGQADNIITTFRSGGPGGLSALIGGPANGTWQLKVVDLAPLDVGKLNRWGLTLSVA